MTENQTRGEIHGCIVCARLYELYVVYDPSGRFVDLKVMSDEARPVKHPTRPLVACKIHPEAEVEAAVARAYGTPIEDED